jgi:hypothetical protein
MQGVGSCFNSLTYKFESVKIKLARAFVNGIFSLKHQIPGIGLV